MAEAALAAQMGGLRLVDDSATGSLEDRQAALRKLMEARWAAADGSPPPPPVPGSASLQLAGIEPVLEVLRELIGWPMWYREEGRLLGLRWPRGLLLHGPPGTGKTAAVRAVAAECGVPLLEVTAASVFGAYTGESERRLREMFEEAAARAAERGVAVVLLDEVDVLCPRRTTQRQHEARVVGQLLTLLDGAGGMPSSAAGGTGGSSGSGSSSGGSGHVVVVAATSRPNTVDPALRRPGRLDREVPLPVPDPDARQDILRLLTRRLPLATDVDLRQVALNCHGYTGADLAALCREAALGAIAAAAATAGADASSSTPAQQLEGKEHQQQQEQKGQEQGQEEALAPRPVTAADFAEARKKVGPSVARGVAADVAPASWDDIGGLEQVKHKLRQSVEWPLRHADAYERLGLSPPRGVLLHGPPGCSKTTLARGEFCRGSRLFSSYVGEGEAALRDAFRRARLAAPSILFLDELDSLVGRRQEGEQTHEAAARVLSTFLTEMDGMELATGVLVLAATNRPGAIDAALLRPGRFDVLLFVPPPDAAGRAAALRVHARSMPLAADVDFEAMAAATELYTGAELAAVCREAALAALREDMEGAREVAGRHFAAARAAVRPSLTAEVLAQYAAWRR
eukprot:scaffold8.g1650.t1